MTPAPEDYAIAAFCEAATNNLDHRIMLAAMAMALDAETRKANSVLLDTNIQAAIHAAEWLKRIGDTHDRS